MKRKAAAFIQSQPDILPNTEIMENLDRLIKLSRSERNRAPEAEMALDDLVHARVSDQAQRILDNFGFLKGGEIRPEVLKVFADEYLVGDEGFQRRQPVPILQVCLSKPRPNSAHLPK